MDYVALPDVLLVTSRYEVDTQIPFGQEIDVGDKVLTLIVIQENIILPQNCFKFDRNRHFGSALFHVEH